MTPHAWTWNRHVALLTAIAVAVPGRAARADGVSAAAMSVNDGGLRDATVHLGASVGPDGAAVAVDGPGQFAYVSTDWRGSDIEVGLGLSWWLTRSLRLYMDAGWILFPKPSIGGGGRILVGLSSRYGDRAFVRPGLAASFAITGQESTITYSLPVEASVEAGYTWAFFSLYGRLAGRLTALTSLVPPTQVEASVNIAVPLGP